MLRVEASGILDDGVGARSQALGGAGVAGLDSPLEALGVNPAALGLTARPRLEIGGRSRWINGEFRNSAGESSELQDQGLIPSGAIGAKWGPVGIALGVVPDSAVRADWRYRDIPGGLGGATTYGERDSFSELMLIRTALGVSVDLTPTLSVGAGVGLLYNRNRLRSPYTIQTQSELAGAKTLLDLDTEGWGWNAQFGVLWKPIPELRFGLSYTLPSKIRASGSASSDAGQQVKDLGLSGIDATADFDAEVTTRFPQIVSAGVSWTAAPKLELLAQLDWINWSEAFDTLDVRLRHTNNELYRTLLAGKSNLDDDIPLAWRDQWVVRAGAEYQLTRGFSIRAGYRYAQNPIPTVTLTPLTAAISEHVVTSGVGYRRGPFTCDLAYQYHLPNTERIGHSRLLSGEYENSEIEISIHSLGLTVSWEF